MAALRLFSLRSIAVISVSWPYWVGMEPVKSPRSNPAKYLVPDVGSVVGNFGHSSNAPAGTVRQGDVDINFILSVTSNAPTLVYKQRLYLYIYLKV